MHPDSAGKLESVSEDHELYNRLIQELKCETNEFLFSRLPQTATLKEFEDIACSIHDTILKLWEKHGYTY